MFENPILCSEDAVSFAFAKAFGTQGQLFFKFHHNLSLRYGRNWYYYCAPEVDVIEVRDDGRVIAYELKGARRHATGVADYPAIHDAIGQAIAYLDLPWIFESNQRLFEGGAFDSVYVVCAREKPDVDEGEKRILSTVPIGAMLALPDGQFVTIKEAPPNPIQNTLAKKHFLENLDTLGKHTTNSRIFRRIATAGEAWFARSESAVILSTISELKSA